ncbi:hypothetical protein [Paenibacillus lentus]|uniref:Uncharacterized protein n=1 Tax=Paenibacillus lentus TaxID=1338368 RepID=A0A3S8RWY1_9BACL|nr:hypothetical protein [Paenibacillus lentus]AZK47675.1 hypothetical protein EIM92_17225 [Paenibacillus lentus]
MTLIRNFRHRSTFVSKGLDLLAMKEIEVGREKQVNFRRGYYINYKGQMIGIVATPKGPLFFCNGDNYLLVDNFSFQLLHDGKKNTFLFTWEGAIKQKIIYTRMLYRKEDQWVDDMVQDFFAWLVAAVKRKKFYSFYTLNENELQDDDVIMLKLAQ